jgi:hypothetical protein
VHDAGIIEHDIESPAFCDSPVDQGLDVLFFAYVAFDSEGSGSTLGDFCNELDGLLCSIPSDVGADDAGTFGRQQHRGLETNPSVVRKKSQKTFAVCPQKPHEPAPVTIATRFCKRPDMFVLVEN